jgi:hypothetical protein
LTRCRTKAGEEKSSVQRLSQHAHSGTQQPEANDLDQGQADPMAPEALLQPVGHKEFVLRLGYKANVIKQSFAIRLLEAGHSFPAVRRGLITIRFILGA